MIICKTWFCYKKMKCKILMFILKEPYTHRMEIQYERFWCKNSKMLEKGLLNVSILLILFNERIFLPQACEGLIPTVGGRCVSFWRSQKALIFIPILI
ncbi:hypothetical protein CN585_07900 [Bacillus toyonensis]|uniref:Uncharacterized protein n=1 Tax=Bacillus toyonensis TaxID=155322 RepID=A0A2A8HHW5_9BACI|nr:hypothetical protein CN585_07900 [Bacillus toyonensis]